MLRELFFFFFFVFRNRHRVYFGQEIVTHSSFKQQNSARKVGSLALLEPKWHRGKKPSPVCSRDLQPRWFFLLEFVEMKDSSSAWLPGF